MNASCFCFWFSFLSSFFVFFYYAFSSFHSISNYTQTIISFNVVDFLILVRMLRIRDGICHVQLCFFWWFLYPKISYPSNERVLEWQITISHWNHDKMKRNSLCFILALRNCFCPRSNEERKYKRFCSISPAEFGDWSY